MSFLLFFILYAIEFMVEYVYIFGLLKKPKINKLYIVLVGIVLFGLSLFVFGIYDVKQCVAEPLMMLGFIILVFDDKNSWKRFLDLQFFRALSSWTAYYIYSNMYSSPVPFGNVCSSDNCTYRTIYGFLYVCSVYAFYTIKVNNKLIKWYNILLVQLMIDLSEAILMFYIFASNYGDITLKKGVWIMIATFFIAISNIMVAIIIPSLVKQKFIVSHNNMQIEFSKIEFNYYEQFLKDKHELRKLKHDIVNYVQVAQSLFSLGKIEETEKIMNQITEECSRLSQIAYCENHIINVILENKKSIAKQNNINFDVNIKALPNKIVLSDMEIASLLSNMIDNAITGCKNSGKIYLNICLDIYIKNGSLVVFNLSNTCLDSMSFSNVSILKSTKDNSVEHGYGMKCISEIVHNHSGNFYVSAKDGLFTAIAYFCNV